MAYKPLLKGKSNSLLADMLSPTEKKAVEKFEGVGGRSAYSWGEVGQQYTRNKAGELIPVGDPTSPSFVGPPTLADFLKGERKAGQAEGESLFENIYKENAELAKKPTTIGLREGMISGGSGVSAPSTIPMPSISAPRPPGIASSGYYDSPAGAFADYSGGGGSRGGGGGGGSSGGGGGGRIGGYQVGGGVTPAQQYAGSQEKETMVLANELAKQGRTDEAAQLIKLMEYSSAESQKEREFTAGEAEKKYGRLKEYTQPLLGQLLGEQGAEAGSPDVENALVEALRREQETGLGTLNTELAKRGVFRTGKQGEGVSSSAVAKYLGTGGAELAKTRATFAETKAERDLKDKIAKRQSLAATLSQLGGGLM